LSAPSSRIEPTWLSGPGKVAKRLVEVGQPVEIGQPLATSMKSI